MSVNSDIRCVKILQNHSRRALASAVNHSQGLELDKKVKIASRAAVKAGICVETAANCALSLAGTPGFLEAKRKLRLSVRQSINLARSFVDAVEYMLCWSEWIKASAEYERESTWMQFEPYSSE